MGLACLCDFPPLSLLSPPLSSPSLPAPPRTTIDSIAFCCGCGCGTATVTLPPVSLPPKLPGGDGKHTGARVLCCSTQQSLYILPVFLWVCLLRDVLSPPLLRIMPLHRRAVLLLYATVRRTAAPVGSSSLSATSRAVDESSSPSRPLWRRTVCSTSVTVDGHAAAASAADAPASAALQSNSHHAPLQEPPRRTVHNKEGYNVIGCLRASGHDVVLGRVRVSFTAYILGASVGLLYLLYYLTTYTYVLTTNLSPHRNSLFFHFPCDMAVIENRLTHRRYTIEVVPEAEPPQRLGHGDHGEGGTAGLACPKPAIVERRLHINWLLYRVFLYLQKTESLVMVDTQAEMAPHRFIGGASSVGKASRASVGFLLEDQLFPDINDDRANTTPSQRRWWQWWSRRASASAALLPRPVSGSSDCATTPAAVAATPMAPTKILLKSSVRLRDATNGYQKGHRYTYEQFIHHAAQMKIQQRYYTYVLARGMAKYRGLRKVYAEELIRNGLLSGDGVTLTELVPNAQQFADEIFAEASAKFGDDVVVYEYTATLY
ncbi:hypothetical protein, conserved [Leishmania shawi]|uniref:Transmembrane protein n=2 Tax=Leishmania guyanensis species complex TaxID=38579 RepID=A0ABR3E4P0_9TRYP